MLNPSTPHTAFELFYKKEYNYFINTHIGKL